MNDQDREQGSLKRRAACEECRNRKLKCSGTRPKTMGRPKKRARSTENSNPQDRTTRQKNTQSHTWDATLPQDQDRNDSTTHDMGTFASAFTPDGSVQPWINQTLPGEIASWDPSDVPALTPDTASLSPAEGSSLQAPPNPLPTGVDPTISDPHCSAIPPASCACLSTLYLTLSTLNTLSAPSFPTSLHPLRSAMQTAKDVLVCEECPKSFTTGLQNTTLLGTLFLSIAERFSKILKSIDAEAARAESAGEKKRFRITDLNGENGTHLHLGGNGCLAAFNMVMSPAEWKAMCKRVVRAEVEGPGVDGGGDGHDECPYFLSLTKQMEERQDRWHRMPLPGDFPKGVEGMFRPAAGKTCGKKEEYHCLKLVGSSKIVVGGFNWS